MLKCICGKEFETEKRLASHKSKCKVYQERLYNVLDDLYNRGVLRRWFDTKNTSFRLCELLNKRHNDVIFNAQKIITYCRRKNIHTPSVKEGNNSPRVKKIRKEHNNLAKGTKGYLKRNATVKEKYGVDNVFQLNSVKQKSKQTMLNKYGVSSPVYLPWYESNNGQMSKPHIKVCDYLKSIGLIENIDFINEERYTFKKFNTFLNKEFCPRPDITLPNKHIVIEVYGDRWHANPHQYQPTDIIHTWYGDISAADIWQRDKIRKNHIESFGYEVIELWENDINNNNFIRTLNRYGI